MASEKVKVFTDSNASRYVPEGINDEALNGTAEDRRWRGWLPHYRPRLKHQRIIPENGHFIGGDVDEYVIRSERFLFSTPPFEIDLYGFDDTLGSDRV